MSIRHVISPFPFNGWGRVALQVLVQAVISGSIENLIALSPSKHLNRAHPLGKTQEVNRDYQYLLLISKTSKISENLTQDSIPQIYDFDKLKEVLAVGFDDENVYEIPYLDFQSISMVIDKNYI